jgi:hypothetical protein
VTLIVEHGGLELALVQRAFRIAATLESHGMDSRVKPENDEVAGRSACRSTVDLLVDLVEHLGTVGAQIGEIAAGQVLDFGDEAVVVAALGHAGAGAGDKIVKHDRVPFMPHWRGRLFLPDDYEHDIGTVRRKRKMLQCTIAASA